MRWFLDLCYGIVAIVTLPVWMTRMALAGKLRTDWAARFGRVRQMSPRPNRPHVLIHAVSVGEVNACRTLVDDLIENDHPVSVTIATTTDTGFRRARDLFSNRCSIVRYPFDFSFSVSRFLDSTEPDLVALIELEVWPNFTAECQRRRIPVCVVNGRLSNRSFARYRRIRPLVKRSFARLAIVGAQNKTYADRFRSLGTSDSQVHVTGQMKWDTADLTDHVEGAEELAIDLGIDRSRPLVVAGSTAPGEEELIHESVGEHAQLLCAPRKPEWFGQAAAALPGAVRRTTGEGDPTSGRFLLDTIGELRMAYSLADLIIVGRTFGNLHGSDMIEPVALGKAVIMGPRFGDFQEAAEALIAAGAIQLATADELPRIVRELLEDAARRAEMSDRGRRAIREHQGATGRNATLIREMLQRKISPPQ